jgi:hypothetical protein
MTKVLHTLPEGVFDIITKECDPIRMIPVLGDFLLYRYKVDQLKMVLKSLT